MEFRSRLRSLLAITAFWTGVACAQPATAPNSEDGAQQVQERKTEEYRRVLSAFDAALQAAPDGVAIAVDRCRFIGKFTDDEYGDFVESAPEDFEDCQQVIEKRWPREPAAQLFGLEQVWGEEAAKRGETILKGADHWPKESRRELLSRISEVEEEDNEERAGELAVEAVRLGGWERVARAVRYLAARKEFAEAARLLAAAPPTKESWIAKGRVEAAMLLPDLGAAAAELRRHAEADVDTAVAARAYLRAGDVASARKVLAGDKRDYELMRGVRFDAAVAAGDFKAAAALVRVTDTKNFPANMQRFVVLAMQAPQTLLQGSMIGAALAMLATLGLLFLLPGLVLVPVHYRGLVRQVRGKPATALFEGIGLRAAWWAGAAILVVPMVVGMVIAPTAVGTMLGEGTLPEGPVVFRMMAWGSFAALLCVLPAARPMGIRHLWGDRAALFAAWRVLVAWAILIGFGMLLSWTLAKTGSGGETTQTKTIDALVQGGREGYGMVATLLLVAGLVPILEELVFRGLLLGGLSRHIGFNWANLLQASLFAASHQDSPRFLFYLALGLLAGRLVRRTNALGPAIALHALNNALAVGVRFL